MSQHTTGNLVGRILDLEGEAIESANVVVAGGDVLGARGDVTDENGSFRVLGLPASTANVLISHIGYHELKFENVQIRLGKTSTPGEIRLQPKTLALQDVVVTAVQPAIDMQSTTVSSNLSSEEFEALPTGRNYLTIAQLMPHSNESFLGDDVNVAGATGQENAYFVDGMNTTDMYLGIGGTSLPYNFIKEIEVKSGGYEAEFGRATGGIVNVITHSGSNELEAKAFGFFTDNRLAQDSRRGFVDLATGDFGRYDAGVSLGGPVVRDKLWFFAAYNGRVEQEDITLEGLGVRTDREVIHSFAGKLTWQPAAKTNVMFSLFGDPVRRDRVGENTVIPFTPDAIANPDVFLGKHERGGVNFSLSASHAFNKNWRIEAALSRSRARQVAQAATEIGKTEPLLIDLTTGVWSGGYGEEWDRRATRNAASLTTTYFTSAHTFKVGAQFENNVFDEDWRWDSENGPHNAGQITRQAENFYVVFPLLPGDWQFSTRNRVVTFFGQGAIAVHPRLRLNLDLRWDGQFFTGSKGKGTESILDQYQPRLGFVLQTGRMGTQKITGSFGRFYEEVPARALPNLFSGPFQEFFVYDHDPFADPTGDVRVIQRDSLQSNTVDGSLHGEHFDEFTFGYERHLGGQFKLGLRGIHRALREIIQNSDDPETGANQRLTGNPGRGILSHMPKATRNYSAVEVTLLKLSGRLRGSASYVLSRTHGNYTGLFSSDSGVEIPNVGTQFDNPEQLVNATGLLPNDRTHVLKLNGSYQFDSGLQAGVFFTLQSGTPLSEIGAHPDPTRAFSYSFLRKRGTVGRSPSIWDLNFRFAYKLNRLFRSNFKQKIILDVFHLFSQREPVHLEQQHFFAVNPETGEQITENPNYLKARLFQPPMTVRLGVEFGF